MRVLSSAPDLDRLVQQALEDSPTLAQARQRLDQARQDYYAQAGASERSQRLGRCDT
jgi:outer membrane protein TolC